MGNPVCLKCVSAGMAGFPGICGRRLSELNCKRAPFCFFGVANVSSGGLLCKPSVIDSVAGGDLLFRCYGSSFL
jgi:hypothetical protein